MKRSHIKFKKIMAITETTFGPKRYLTLRKSISTDQIADKQMYDEAGKKLAACIEDCKLTRAGAWSVLYFLWDETGKKAEIGISFPIASGDEMVHDPELAIVDIPESKAAMD